MSFRRVLVTLAATVSAAALVAGAFAVQPSSLEETLLVQEKQILTAIEEHDEAKLEEMLRTQAFAVTLAGGRETNDELLRRLSALPPMDIDVSDVKLVEVAKDVAILSYRYTANAHRGPDSPSFSAYATSTWVHRDGEWQSIFYQETPINKK